MNCSICYEQLWSDWSGMLIESRPGQIQIDLQMNKKPGKFLF